jgi:hypothetical protein
MSPCLFRNIVRGWPGIPGDGSCMSIHPSNASIREGRRGNCDGGLQLRTQHHSKSSSETIESTRSALLLVRANVQARPGQHTVLSEEECRREASTAAGSC